MGEEQLAAVLVLLSWQTRAFDEKGRHEQTRGVVLPRRDAYFNL